MKKNLFYIGKMGSSQYGIITSENANAEFHIGEMTDIHTNIVITKNPSELDKFGLKPDIPWTLIESASDELKKEDDESKHVGIIEKYQIDKWMETGANATTIISFFVRSC